MSHSCGQVRFNDGLIKHFEYNGTTDVCIPILYPTFEEMDKYWRSSKWMKCICNKESESVIIAVSYGNGFSWEGKACKYCNVITENLTPDWIDFEDGIPEWYKF